MTFRSRISPGLRICDFFYATGHNPSDYPDGMEHAYDGGWTACPSGTPGYVKLSRSDSLAPAIVAEGQRGRMR